MEGEQPRLPRSLTLEEFLEEDLGSPGSPQPSFPPALLRPGGRAWDALAPIPPLPPTPQLSDDGEGLADPTAMGPDPGWRKPGREVLSPDTTEAPSQVPVLNALEAEESTLSDACLLDDRIGLSSAVKKLAHELRKVSITRREHAVLRKEEMDAEEARRSAIATMRPSNFEHRARGGPQDVARPESERKTQDQTSALASTLRKLFISPELPELQCFPRQVAEVLKPDQPETYTGDLNASAVVMAKKMLQLEGQLGAAVQSSWVPKLQLALARQREQEAELEKEVHLARLHLRRLAQDVAEAKLRRQELEEEQAEFVPFATKELEDAMQQMANNRRAPESLRRLVPHATPRSAASTKTTRKRVPKAGAGRPKQLATPPTFGRIFV